MTKQPNLVFTLIGLCLFLISSFQSVSCRLLGSNLEPLPDDLLLTGVYIVSLDSVKNNGEKWDPDGTGPDLSINIWDNATSPTTSIFKSAVIKDYAFDQDTIHFPISPPVTILRKDVELLWSLDENCGILGATEMHSGYVSFAGKFRGSTELRLRNLYPTIVLTYEYE